MNLITFAKHYVRVRHSRHYLFPSLFTALVLLLSSQRASCSLQANSSNEVATSLEAPSNVSEVLFSSDEFVDHKEAPVLLFDGGLTDSPPVVAKNDTPSTTTTTTTSAVQLETSTVKSENSTSDSTPPTSEIAKSSEAEAANTTSATDEAEESDDEELEDEANRDNGISSSSSSQKQFKPPQNVSQYMDYIETLFHDLGHQITDLFEPHIPQLIRTSQMVQLSGSCSYDMLRMALALRHFEPWALRMIDSSGKLPEGIFEGSFTALGSYDECLNTQFKSASSSAHHSASSQAGQASQASSSATTGGGNEKAAPPTQGKYCLVNVSPFLPPKPPADKVERVFQEEANRRNYTKDDQFSRLSPMFYYMKFRIGVCIPSTCDQSDMESISQALSSSLRLNITIPDCRVRQATPLTNHQFAGGLVFASVLTVVVVATLLDWSRRNWNQLVDRELGALVVNLVNEKGAKQHVDGVLGHSSVVLTGISRKHATQCFTASGRGDNDLHSKATSKPKNRTFAEQLEKHWAWMSFSLLANFRLYFKQSRSRTVAGGQPVMIRCLNGIRVLSLCWVMVANSYITLDPRATKRLLKTREAPRDFLFQLVVQASLAIETFFFLSGILMSLSFSRQLAKRDEECAGDVENNRAETEAGTRRRSSTVISWLQFYVHRYVRMTPATMLVIAISMYAYRYGDGPLWFEATHRSHQNCRENWWRHLLHVANFIDTRQMCFIHYWYIAADMQLFLFAPVLMFLVYRYRRVGYSLVALIGAASVGFIFYTTYERNLPPTLLFYNSDPESRREFGNTIMTKPLTHALPYLVGMLVGHWLTSSSRRLTRIDHQADRSQQQQQQILLRNYGKMSLATLLGSTATVVALIELFLPYKWNNSQLPTRFMASLYAALFRFGWSLVLAYVVVSCRHAKDKKCLRKQLKQQDVSAASDCCCQRGHSDAPGCHKGRVALEQEQYCFCGSGGSLINRFLSLSVFTHLSRLSFVAYLIHLPLMSVFISQTRGLFAFSHTLVIHLALSYLVMTFILSFVLVHIIEFPFITFERYLFNNLLSKQQQGQARSGGSSTSMRFVYENKSMSHDGEFDTKPSHRSSGLSAFQRTGLGEIPAMQHEPAKRDSDNGDVGSQMAPHNLVNRGQMIGGKQLEISERL